MKWLWGAFVLAACGDVPVVSDAPANKDSPFGDGQRDGAGANCMTDNFEGTTLAAHWSVLAGAIPPAYTVAGSALSITDAPFASTPSMPTKSWVYDMDTDKANQIAWAQAIGGQDFTLTASINWSSISTELIIGAIGVSDAQGTLAAYAGAQDGSSVNSAGAAGRLHVAGAGTDMFFANPPVQPGAANFKIQRVAGTATIYVDDVSIVMGPMPDLISNVVILYVRHQNGATMYDYGSSEFRALSICTP